MTTEEPRRFVPITERMVPKLVVGRTGSITCQYVFREGDRYTFMDEESFEQYEFAPEQIGSSAVFLREGLEGIIVTFYADFLVSVCLPALIELKVTSVSIVLDEITGKSSCVATLETEATVIVPPEVQVGQIVRIDTKDGTFSGIVTE